MDPPLQGGPFHLALSKKTIPQGYEGSRFPTSLVPETFLLCLQWDFCIQINWIWGDHNFYTWNRAARTRTLLLQLHTRKEIEPSKATKITFSSSHTSFLNFLKIEHDAQTMFRFIHATNAMTATPKKRTWPMALTSMAFAWVMQKNDKMGKGSFCYFNEPKECSFQKKLTLKISIVKFPVQNPVQNLFPPISWRMANS